MRSFSHWTLRYIKDRISVFYYEKKNPDTPWLTPLANKIFDSYLTKSDIGLEFGSGRSTIWFANRISHLTSVEHDENWADNVQKIINNNKLKNVDYNLIPKSIDTNNEGQAEYVKIIEKFDDNSLDFCLIDGIYRDFCAKHVLKKIRPSGLLVIDNVNRYLPCKTYSPNSRNLSDGPDGPVWNDVQNSLSSWRKIWTSSGVTDTAFFIKPCEFKP